MVVCDRCGKEYLTEDCSDLHIIETSIVCNDCLNKEAMEELVQEYEKYYNNDNALE